MKKVKELNHHGKKTILMCLFYGVCFYYHRIKKGEDQGKYVTFSTMMHKEAGEILEMTSHHVTLRQVID